MIEDHKQIIDLDLNSQAPVKIFDRRALQSSVTHLSPVTAGFSAVLEGKHQISGAESGSAESDADFRITLTEVLEVGQNATHLNKQDLGKLIITIETHVFRPLPEVDPILLRSDLIFRSEDSRWPHLTLSYQTLRSIILAVPNEKHFNEFASVRHATNAVFCKPIC
jgi:hypothetical protein